MSTVNNRVIGVNGHAKNNGSRVNGRRAMAPRGLGACLCSGVLGEIVGPQAWVGHPKVRNDN